MTNLTDTVDATAPVFTAENQEPMEFRLVDEAPAKIDISVCTLDKRALEQLDMGLSAFISLNDLGHYGFTGDIVSGLMEFAVFPQVYKYRNKLLVLRKDVFGLVEVLLNRSVLLYRAVDEKDRAEQYIRDNAVKLAELGAERAAAEAESAAVVVEG